MVYTLDGSTPTAKSTTVESGKEISINGTCTLKVGLLVNGEVRNIATHQYTIEKFKAYKFMIYVNADAVKWNPLYCYTWKGANSDWQGQQRVGVVVDELVTVVTAYIPSAFLMSI